MQEGEWKGKRGAFHLIRDSSVLMVKSFGPSYRRSSIIDWTFLGNPERWSQGDFLMTTALAMDFAAMSAETRMACNAVLDIRCTSEIRDLNCSFSLQE